MRLRYYGADATQDSVQRITERETKVLDRRLAKIADDLKLLDITLDHHTRDDNYTAKLVLRILERNIAASNTGTTREMALRGAFDDLNDQLDKFMAKLRSEPAIRNEQRKVDWLKHVADTPEEVKT